MIQHSLFQPMLYLGCIWNSRGITSAYWSHFQFCVQSLRFNYFSACSISCSVSHSLSQFNVSHSHFVSPSFYLSVLVSFFFSSHSLFLCTSVLVSVSSFISLSFTLFISVFLLGEVSLTLANLVVSGSLSLLDVVRQNFGQFNGLYL